MTRLERFGEALMLTYDAESRVAHAMMGGIARAARRAVAFLGRAVSKVPPLT